MSKEELSLLEGKLARSEGNVTFSLIGARGFCVTRGLSPNLTLPETRESPEIVIGSEVTPDLIGLFSPRRGSAEGDFLLGETSNTEDLSSSPEDGKESEVEPPPDLPE